MPEQVQRPEGLPRRLRRHFKGRSSQKASRYAWQAYASSIEGFTKILKKCVTSKKFLIFFRSLEKLKKKCYLTCLGRCTARNEGQGRTYCKNWVDADAEKVQQACPDQKLRGAQGQGRLECLVEQCPDGVEENL